MTSTRKLTVDGRRLPLDGRPLRPFGLRLANALEDDWHADRLIAHLGEYAAHGIDSFSVFLQGAWSGTANAFRADGSLDPVYMDRLARIIEAADGHEMAVNVGYLYQSRPYRVTEDKTELERLMRGEQSREGWALHDVFRDGDAGGIVLIHGMPTRLKKQVTQHYPNVPVVENESGNWLGCLDRYDSVGVFSDEMKATFKADCKEMFEAGAYWYLLSRWQQLVPMRFDLGGDGTPESPGIRWMLEYCRELWKGTTRG